MALVALRSSARNPSACSGSEAPSPGPPPSSPAIIRWAAGGIPLAPCPELPVHVVAHPELGVLVHPDATAPEVASGIWLYLRAQGLTGDDATLALILPTARRRLRTVRAKISRGAA